MTQTDPGLEAMTTLAFIVAAITTDPTLRDIAGGAEALAERVTDGSWAGSGSEGPQEGDWAVLVTVLDPQDVKVVGQVQVAANVRAQVKVVGQVASFAPLVPIYRAVHAALEGRQDVAALNGTVLTVQRVSGFQFPERANGIEYRHLGGLYEAITQ